MDMKTRTLTTTIDSDEKPKVLDVLSHLTDLSREQIEEALWKGALWLRRKGRPGERLRNGSVRLRRGDRLELHYDESVLARVPPEATLVDDRQGYSVWYKPPGLLTQGTRQGDHCSLMRQVELFFTPPRKVHPIHRLDREVGGLLVAAHNRECAAAFSKLIEQGGLEKEYRAEVRGNPGREGERGRIDHPLNGKRASTRFRVIAYDRELDTARVALTIETGRLHQIRRHLAMEGFPVMGDPRYGRRNKNREGLRLEACSLRFTCPLEGRKKTYCLPNLYSSSSPEIAFLCDD